MSTKVMERSDPCSNPGCNGKVPLHQRNCLVCSKDAGFPNVRTAISEAVELDKRYTTVIEASEKTCTREAVSRLEVFLQNSRAVMVRSIPDMLVLIGMNNRLMSTFGHQVEAGMRFAEDNEWDNLRIVAEPMIHPHYHNDIQYAILSNDDLGVTDPTYGGCHVSFREVAYRDRATVFEENAIIFVNRHKLLVTDSVPSGYRATWSERHKLGVAKLGAAVTEASNDSDFAALLRSGVGKDSDFIEVHIHGLIHPDAIEKISVIANAVDEDDLRMLKSYCRKNKVEIGEVQASTGVSK